jgi:hypothetical protein
MDLLTLFNSISSPSPPPTLQHTHTRTSHQGGTSRVSVVKKRLGAILGLDPSAMNFGLKTTMNSDEAVARGESW